MKQTAVGAVGETSCFQFQRPSQIQPSGDYIFTSMYLSEGEKTARPSKGPQKNNRPRSVSEWLKRMRNRYTDNFVNK